jgi:hypothetical protein
MIDSEKEKKKDNVLFIVEIICSGITLIAGYGMICWFLIEVFISWLN